MAQTANSKIFPWVLNIQKEFLKSFPGDYDHKTLQLLQKYVGEELLETQKHNRTGIFFETLVEFYSHFCWKIKWDEPSPHMKDACVQLLADVTKVGVLLSKGDPYSSFCDRIMAAIKMFPGENNLLYTALLLVTHLKKKFHSTYGVILKHVLFSGHLKTKVPEEYLKAVFLLRRLKSMSKDRSEKNKVHLLASGLKPPPDTLQWIASRCPDVLSGIEIRSLGSKLMSKTLSVNVYSKLREVLLPGLGAESNTFLGEEKLEHPGSFVIDAAPGAQSNSECSLRTPTSVLESSPDLLMERNLIFPKRKRRSSLEKSECLSALQKTISNKHSSKKVKKAIESPNDSGTPIDGTALQTESVSSKSFKSMDFATSSANNVTHRKLGKGKKRLSNLVGEESLLWGDLLSTDEQLEPEEPSGDAMPKKESLFVPATKRKRLLKTKRQEDSADQSNNLICSVDSQEENETQVTELLSCEETILVNSSALDRKSVKLLPDASQPDSETDSVEQDDSSNSPTICEELKEAQEVESTGETQEVECVSIEEAEMIQPSAPIRKSRRLLAIPNQPDVEADSVVDKNDSSAAPGDSKELKEVHEMELGKESSSDHMSATTRRSRRLHPISSQPDVETDSHQNDSSVSPTICEEVEETQEVECVSIEEAEMIQPSAQTRKSRRLLPAVNQPDVEADSVVDKRDSSVSPGGRKQVKEAPETQSSHSDESDVVTDSADQKISSVTADDSQELKEVHEIELSKEPSLDHMSATTRRSRRLHPISSQPDVEMDSHQDDRSVSPAVSEDLKEAQENELKSIEEAEMTQPSAPTRKSRRLLAVANQSDVEADAVVDKRDGSVSPGGSKQVKEAQETQSSCRDESDVETDSADQKVNSVAPGDSKELKEELSQDYPLDHMSVTTRRSRRLHPISCQPVVETDSHQDDRSVSPTICEEVEETQEVECVSIEEPEMTQPSAPTRKSRRLLPAVVNHPDVEADSDVNENDSSAAPGASKELKEELSKEFPSDHMSASSRRSRRLHPILSQPNVETGSHQDDRSVSPTICEEEVECVSIEKPEMIQSSAPTRKSRRLLAVDDKPDVEADSDVDKNDSSVTPGDSKELKEVHEVGLSKETSLDHMSATTRKSRRLHPISSQPDVETDSHQDDRPVSPAVSEELKEAQENELRSIEEPKLSQSPVPIRKSARLHCITSQPMDSVDQNISSVSPAGNKQEKESQAAELVSNEDPALVDTSLPARKSTRLLAVASQLYLEIDAVEQESSCQLTDKKQEVEETCAGTSPSKESASVRPHTATRKSKRLLALENKILPEVDSAEEETEFKVIETDTGFKIMSRSSDHCASLRKSSDAAQNETSATSDGVKYNKAHSAELELLSPGNTSPNLDGNHKNIPVVVISPAEGADICSRYEPAAIDNHLLHPSNYKDSVSPNDKKPDFDLGERAPSHSNVPKPEIESTDSELRLSVCDRSLLKNEDNPASSISLKLKTPEKAISSDSLHENLRGESFDKNHSKTQISSTSDTLDINLKEDCVVSEENVVKDVVDKILSSIENVSKIKTTPDKRVICKKSCLGPVSGMTFSPLFRKSKHYLSFTDVTRKNDSSCFPDKTCTNEELDDQRKTKDREFSGYRDYYFEDNKSEGILSEIVKMDLASSDASVCDSHNEDFDDEMMDFTENWEIEGNEHSINNKSEKLLDETLSSESRAEENKTASLNEESVSDSPLCESESKISPTVVDDIGNNSLRDSSSDPTTLCASDADASGDASVAEIPETSSPNLEKDECVQAVDVEAKDVEIDVNAPLSMQLASKKDVKESSTVTANKKKPTKSCPPPKKGSTSYSLRRTTRSRAAHDENVQLGLEFTKLNIGPSSQKSKKVTFKEEEEVGVEEECDEKPAPRRTTRSTATVTSCAKDQTSNTESHNLRRSKRAVVLPGKLKLK